MDKIYSRYINSFVTTVILVEERWGTEVYLCGLQCVYFKICLIFISRISHNFRYDVMYYWYDIAIFLGLKKQIDVILLLAWCFAIKKTPP